MEILILTVLILLNGFFSLSEIALVSSKRSRLEQLRNEGRNGASTALRLLDNSGNFLSAIQVGITLIGIVTGYYGGSNLADDVAPLFEKIGFIGNSAHNVALVLTIIIITYFSIVIGELVPKIISLSNPEKIAIRIAPFISFFSKSFYPFIKFLSSSTSVIVKILGIKHKIEHITEAELRQMIKLASREGVIEQEQNKIHEKVFYFSDKRAKHIMTHRTEVEWINLKKPEEVIRSEIMGTKHSKILCCNGSLENFAGVLVVRDYLISLNRNKEMKIKDLLVQPLIIPETSDAHKVLELFKEKLTQFCVVVNEYGSFEGIITLHDIMENIIGEVPEEGEPYEPDIFIRDDKSVLVNGDAPAEILDGIIEGFTIDFEKVDYSTVAGFVFSKINRIPRIGDKIEYAGYSIEIIDIDGNRIDKVLIRKI
ncbi:MAG TPA: HlyC/CorC family transporter [Bacteroidales bacterium]|nr:HlyC/CorC family transporter [Bacteroidales bacterium]